MKVLMVLERSFPPDERVENEINILTESNIQITLLCYSSKGKSGTESNKNLTIIRFPLPKIMHKLSAIALLIPIYFNFWEKHIKKVLELDKFDALHIHDLPLIKVGYKLSKKFNIPLISDLHENRPEIMKMYKHVNSFPGKFLISIKKWQKYQKKYTPLADKLILVTEEAKEYYETNFNIHKDKITVLPNYVVLDRIKNIPLDTDIPSYVNDKFTLVYFGDTGLRRGILTIIEAAKKLRREEEFHFLILGDSKEQEQIEKIVQQEKLSNVTLTGWIPLAKAINYIRNSKVGLCPFLRNVHHDTTYANKMFQYMALGKPVIVSDCEAQANVINRESCGLIFKAGDVNELTNKILEVYSAERYNVMSRNAAISVTQKYNWSVNGERIRDLYRGLEK